VCSSDLVSKKFRRWKILLLNNVLRGLSPRVAPEVSADEFPVPAPVVLSVCRRVYSNESATSLDIAFESDLLTVIQYVSGCIQKDDRGIPLQRVFIEISRVGGCIHQDTIFFSQLLHCGNSHGYGLVIETS